MNSNDIYIIATIWLVVSAICFLVIAFDIMSGHKQQMPVMNIVWPLTALYGSVFALIAYYKTGRNTSMVPTYHDNMQEGDGKISWKSIMKSTLHCGSGCMLGDILAETFVVFVPLTLWGSEVFGTWLADYIAAFIIGIAFQYFSIKPMKHLSSGGALKESLKADFLSLTAWQIGMYGWMAVVIFCIYQHPLPKTSPGFWFMMQIAMLAGFCTAYPVNWWLLKKKIKEAM